MATAIDLSNEILGVFINVRDTQMPLSDLHQALAKQINRLTIDEILRTVRSPSLSNLFELQTTPNNLYFIRLHPKLILCEACQKRSCKTMHCTNLHICCFMPNCSYRTADKPCRFPHKLHEHPNNMILLRTYHYDMLDEDLLLDLLLFYHKTTNERPPAGKNFRYKRPPSSQSNRAYSNNTPSKTPNHRLMKTRLPSQLDKSPIQTSIVTDNVSERQLDISIPSERNAPDVDLEIVQLVLATNDINIERTLEKQISNDFYRRYTLQFNDKQVVEKILQKEPIIMYNNIPIKMKRTVRRKDTRIFALKFDTDQKINSVRLDLYVETLVGKVSKNIFDMTPDGNAEQIHLIRCEQSIDFDHLYKAYSTKNTLQNYRATVTEVYEAEALEVTFVHGASHAPMSMPRLRQLLGETRWTDDVFACINIRDQNSADIELMNAEVTTKWLAEASRMEQQLSLIIHPIIDFIEPLEKNTDEDDDEEITSLLTATQISSPLSSHNGSTDSPKGDNESNFYKIRQDWRIVLTHPVFGEEYRNYIHEQLNIAVQIIGSTIQVPNEQTRKEIARHTNMFIQKFIFQEFTNLDKVQLKIVKDNYSRMAHRWQKDTNKTLVAARRDVMNELFPRPGSATQQQPKPLPTPTFQYKQSPVPKKLEPQPTPLMMEVEPMKQSPTPQSQLQTIENNLYTLPYSIENTVYLPFFSPSNSFPDRLSTYLSNTFHIKLDIKSISSTKLILELKGQQKDVCDARSALASLLASLKTKTYSDLHDSYKFVIPDVYRVVQWNLNQRSIVSSCNHSSKNGGTLSVRYFADNPQFGVDEQELEDVILQHLFGTACQLTTASRTLETAVNDLQKKIQQRMDYGQHICCFYTHQNGSMDRNRLPSLYLCGTKSLVLQISKEVNDIVDQYTPIPCNVQLSPNQVNYLLQMCSADLIKFEKEHETDGVDIRSKLKSDTTSQFLAPKSLHEQIKLLLLEMSQIEMVSRAFPCSTQVFDEKKQEINTLASKNRCLLSVAASSLSRAARPRVTHASSRISSGTINVSNGDLTAEKSDVLVVCSSSVNLHAVITKAAGAQVEQELKGKDLSKNMIDTSSGELKQAKRLLFLPWSPPSDFSTNQDISALHQSITAFVQEAIKYTIQGRFQSIAFPAIGCGGFAISPDIIASAMIDAAREQLVANPTVQLTITFAVQQPHVYDVFHAKLNPSATNAVRRNRSPSPSRQPSQGNITITLTTSTSNIDKAKKLLDTIANILV